jgi:hypothetical protein
MKQQLRAKGFSLAELLLGMALFALLITSVASFSIDAIRAVRNSSTKVVAAQRIQEMSNALLLNKDALWSLIVSNTGAGSKSLVYQNNTYVFQDGAVSDIGISLQFTIAQTYRDALGNIVASGGTLDVHTRTVIFTAQWTDFLGLPNSVASTVYVSDWNTLKLLQTTDTEFSAGTNNATVITKTSDGEVTMETVIYADWCNPALTQNSYDLPGQGIAKTISAQPGNIYMGTGSNSSGVSFARMSFVPSEPPSVSVLGVFDGYKTNAVFGSGNYAYLATQTNSKEVVILNVATTPYTEIGYFNPPINSEGKGVFVNGDLGIMATTSRLYTFDLTAKTGARPSIGYISLSGTVTDLFVRGNFAYVTLSNSTTEMQILDFTNPASIQSVGWFDLNNTSATTVFVNEDETRAYVGTSSTSSQRELFVVDVVNKSGSHTSIGSYETNGMTVKDVVVPAGSNRAILVGSGGTEQYQVVTIDNETNPQYCGGLAVVNGVNAIAAVTETNGNVYSHVVTTNATTELRTIKGGPGGGGGSGYGYLSSGDYTSPVFDSTSPTAQYYSIEWSAAIPQNSGLKLQLRSSNDPTMTGSVWIGPDGTGATYFTSQTGTGLPQSLNNKRYFQYKAFFESADNITTAILNQIEFTYQK